MALDLIFSWILFQATILSSSESYLISPVYSTIPVCSN
nr:MAG TPA: hypothetical protein [Caudoviricetes sp.]